MLSSKPTFFSDCKNIAMRSILLICGCCCGITLCSHGWGTWHPLWGPLMPSVLPAPCLCHTPSGVSFVWWAASGWMCFILLAVGPVFTFSHKTYSSSGAFRISLLQYWSSGFYKLLPSVFPLTPSSYLWLMPHDSHLLHPVSAVSSSPCLGIWESLHVLLWVCPVLCHHCPLPQTSLGLGHSLPPTCPHIPFPGFGCSASHPLVQMCLSWGRWPVVSKFLKVMGGWLEVIS